MKQSSKTATVIVYVLLALLAAAAIGLFIFQTAQNGWVVDKSNATKFGLLMVGLGLTLVKLHPRVGSQIGRAHV